MADNHDSTLWLYTSLTAGSSHIITATSRLETILKANKIPFRAIDVATDDKARQLWGRRSKGRRLPGLVKYNQVVGDLEQIEEWNEYGELKQQIAALSNPDDFTSLAPTSTAAGLVHPPQSTKTSSMPSLTTPVAASKESGAVAPKSTSPHIQIQNPPVNRSDGRSDKISLAWRQAGEEAAQKAKERARANPAPKIPTSEAGRVQLPSADPKDKGSVPLTTVTSKKGEGEGEPKSPATVESESKSSVDDKEKSAISDESKDTAKAPPATEASSPTPDRTSESAEERQPAVAGTQRPSLASEVAAVSTADLNADNAETLGLVEHHRSSIVSATTDVEKDQVAQDLRESVSKRSEDADVDNLRNIQKEGRDASIKGGEEQGDPAAEEEKTKYAGPKEKGGEEEPVVEPSTVTAAITQPGKETESEPKSADTTEE